MVPANQSQAFSVGQLLKFPNKVSLNAFEDQDDISLAKCADLMFISF